MRTRPRLDSVTRRPPFLPGVGRTRHDGGELARNWVPCSSPQEVASLSLRSLPHRRASGTPQTLNDRAGFLCNYEVLEVLRQQQQERIKQIKVLTGGKGGEVNGKRIGRYQDIAQREEAERIQPQDLHTVSWEVSLSPFCLLPGGPPALTSPIAGPYSQAVQYLEADVHPMRRQTSAAVATLLDGLDNYDLTKSERLQIVNLAPTTLVELQVVRPRPSSWGPFPGQLPMNRGATRTLIANPLFPDSASKTSRNGTRRTSSRKRCSNWSGPTSATPRPKPRP